MGVIRKKLVELISSILGKRFYLLVKDFEAKLNQPLKHRQINLYNKHRDFILKDIVKGEKINIVFFLNTLAMWKYHELFRLLNEDDRFNPVIIPFVGPNMSQKIAIENRVNILEYCRINKFPFEEIFNYDDMIYDGLAKIPRPTILSFTQPYDTSYPELKLKNFINDTIFIYTPYGVGVDHKPMFYDTIIQNIAICNFESSVLEQKCQIENSYNHGKNTYVVGLPISDELNNCHVTPWKSDKRKKIIWAPHHSIKTTDTLSSSTFFDICEEMLHYALSMNDKIQIAFKPHPVLKDKLYEIWGEKRTDEYYNQWRSMENTFLSEDSYVGLFKYSDAMIHDCSSFTCEYLIIDKPVLYLSKNNRIKGLNEFGRACYAQHYKGCTIEDITNFIENQVIGGEDYMKINRSKFVKEQLRTPGNNTVGTNMYNVLCSIVEQHQLSD